MAQVEGNEQGLPARKAGTGVGLYNRSNRRKKRFLSALASCGVVVDACREVGVPVSTVYRTWRLESEFVALMDLAHEVGDDVLRARCTGEVARRAFDERSDGMLYFLTKRYDPRFKDNHALSVGVIAPGSVQIVLAGSEADRADE